MAYTWTFDFRNLQRRSFWNFNSKSGFIFSISEGLLFYPRSFWKCHQSNYQSLHIVYQFTSCMYMTCAVICVLLIKTVVYLLAVVFRTITFVLCLWWYKMMDNAPSSAVVTKVLIHSYHATLYMWTLMCPYKLRESYIILTVSFWCDSLWDCPILLLWITPFWLLLIHNFSL